MAVTAAAVAVKVAVVAPEGTSTEAGTVKAEVRLLERKTVEPAVGADLEIVTVQVVEAEAARVVLPHCREESVMGANSERLALVLAPFKVAVAVAC